MTAAIKSQYYATLTMLESAIRQCDKDLWTSEAYQHQFWWVAYHALHYADLYLAPREEDFVAWAKHVPAFEGASGAMDPRTIKAANLPEGCEAYTQADLLEYVTDIKGRLDSAVEKLDLDGPSGFNWLPFNKLELQFYNIRHIQHHAGQLIERIRQNQDEGVAWVGMDKRAGH